MTGRGRRAARRPGRSDGRSTVPPVRRAVPSAPSDPPAEPGRSVGPLAPAPAPDRRSHGLLRSAPPSSAASASAAARRRVTRRRRAGSLGAVARRPGRRTVIAAGPAYRLRVDAVGRAASGSSAGTPHGRRGPRSSAFGLPRGPPRPLGPTARAWSCACRGELLPRRRCPRSTWTASGFRMGGEHPIDRLPGAPRRSPRPGAAVGRGGRRAGHRGRRRRLVGPPSPPDRDQA